MSAKRFLTKCGTVWRFLLFESPDNGGWTSVWNRLGAKVQYVNIYSELNLSSSLNSDDSFRIQPSGLLTFISASLFIYIFILYPFSLFMYYIISYENASEEQKTDKLLSFSLTRKLSCLFEHARQIITMLRCLHTMLTDRQTAVFYRSAGSPAWAKHVFLGVI